MSRFKTAAVFSNNMVLQRDKNVCIFGVGEPGERVTVAIEGITAFGRVNADGKWTVRLPAHEAATDLSMKITCGSEEKTFSNIAYGEVWLAGGQSNMELELQNCKEKAALTEDKEPGVRFYYTQKKTLPEKDFYSCEENTCWSEFDSESAKCWSAVGYFFARDIAKRLGVTVGVIGCNWGGTSASYWMSRESLEKDADLKTYLDEYDNAISGKSDKELEEEWQKYCDYDKQWQKKCSEFYEKNPQGEWDDCVKYAGPCGYPGPQNPFNPFHATALYHSMVQRVCPYTLRGVIWYQGETDDCKPKTYFKLFRAMIQLWRDDWGDDELPFMFVQLPMHRYKADPDWKHWCIIREAQMKAYKTIKNTGIAIALDLGEFNEIHPKTKQPVGERLALQAMVNVYGDKSLEKEAFSPMFRNAEAVDGGLLLSFDHCDGFEVKGEPTGFEIAGEDKEFKPAEAQIRGDRIFISCKEISEPLYGRYCWTNYGEVAFFGKNGLPLAPFRTCKDDER